MVLSVLSRALCSHLASQLHTHIVCIYARACMSRRYVAATCACHAFFLNWSLGVQMFEGAGETMTKMEKMPGDKGVTHYQGIGSMAGRMHENLKDSLPSKAKPARAAEVKRYREEDEMWG